MSWFTLSGRWASPVNAERPLRKTRLSASKTSVFMAFSFLDTHSFLRQIPGHDGGVACRGLNKNEEPLGHSGKSPPFAAGRVKRGLGKLIIDLNK